MREYCSLERVLDRCLVFVACIIKEGGEEEEEKGSEKFFSCSILTSTFFA